MGDILNNLPAMPEIPALPEGLGNLAGSFSFEAIWAKICEFFGGHIANLKAMVPAQIMDIYNTHKVLFLLAIICVLGLVAFEGYRFFRMLTYAGSAFLFGLIGYWYVSPMLEATIKPMIPEIIDYHALVGVVFALAAILLCYCAFNFVVFLIGALAGYFVGSVYVYQFIVNYFNTLDFLKADTVKYIIGGVFAVICAMVFVLMFKLLFMVTTSFGASVIAMTLLQSIVVPGGDDNVKIAFEILGIAIGIFALVRQRKQESDSIFRF